MPRSMSPAMLAAIQATLLRPAVLLEAHFASETVYMWTGTGNLSWNSITWLGIGSLLKIEAIEDGATVDARGTVFTVSGFDPALLADVVEDFQLGLPVIMRLALFDASSVIVADPIICWSGRMDQPTVSVDGKTATIAIACENRLLDMNVPVDRRYTQQDQQMDWPGDLGMSFVAGIQEMTLIWGLALSSTNV